MIKSGSFTFNGKSSEDFGLVVQTPPVYMFPERDITVTHIPGRNGDIAIDKKCFKNTTREYSIALWYMPKTGYYDNFEKVLNWLNSAKGSYAKLEDTYDTEVYRKATFHMSGSFTDYWSKAGTINIQFDCKPQRYLKTGDEATEFNGPTAQMNNEYDYISLPTISIEGIDTESTENLDKVLMMSVSNDNSDTITETVGRSIITFQKYSGDVTIDSDEQTVTSSNNRDIYGNVNLNGTPFPRFGKGTNKIEFKKYTLENTRLDSYNSKLTASQKTVSSEYKVYAAIQQLKQESFFIRKYDSLLSSKQESYLASSLQSLIDSKSESYTFQSFNTLLNNYGSNYTFTGTADDNNGTVPDWLTINDNEDGTVTATANQNGFYRVDAEDKKLKFVAEGAVISSTLKSTNVNSILYYESVDEGGEHKLKVGYTDLPDWLTYIIENDKDGSPSKITYQIKRRVKEDETTVINGYYWTDKTWLFGKAQWNKTDFKNNANINLASVSWSTSKKAFVNMSGISVSTTSTFTYKFYEGTTMPEYEPVKKETVDDNGVKHTDITNAVHFTVSSPDGSLSKVILIAKDDGFYKVIPDKGTGGIDNWTAAKKDGTLNSVGIDGTVAFEVGYVKKAPDYSGESTKNSKWPAWLESNPYISVNGAYSHLFPSDYTENSKIVFKITQPGYYRISSGSSDDTPKVEEDWVHLTANDISKGKYTDELITKLGSKDVTSTDGHYIYRLETMVDKPDNNRVFMYRDAGSTESTMHNDPPDWLQVNYLPEDVTSSLTQETNGYIDSNGAFVQTTDKPKSKYSNYYSISNKYRYYIGASVNNISITYAIYDDSKNKITVGTNSTNKELVLDNLSENAKYIRLSTPDADVNPIILKQEQIDGTPNRVSYIAKVAGYYRYDSNQVWTKHKIGDSIMPAISGKDDTVIYFLEGELPEVEIADKNFARYLTARIIQDSITSNPTEVEFIIKEAGYYRYNNIVNWKYYNSGDTLFTSKINESGTVYHLKATGDDLSNLKIKIKPRWWVL